MPRLTIQYPCFSCPYLAETLATHLDISCKFMSRKGPEVGQGMLDFAEDNFVDVNLF